VLDLAPLALCLSINEPRAIIVDAKLDNLNIVVMADRVPQVIRSLALQSEIKTLSENLPTISEEFSRTVAFYNSSHQQEPLNSEVPVFVSGDLANAPDTWQTLVGKLNSKVAVLPSAIQYPADFPGNDFIVNLGLAAKALSLEKEPANYSLVNLNALPAWALPKAVNPYRVLVPVVAVAGIAGVVILWNAWQNNVTNTKSLESQLTATQSLITGNAKSIATLTEQNRLTQAQIQPIKDTANIFTAKLSSLAAARSVMNSDLHQIIALKPPTVAVTGVMHSGSAMTVTGLCANHLVVLDYAQALRDTGGFTTVVSSISYSPTITEAGVVIPSYNFVFQMK
jgi:type IV pilus assembly protein PilM